MREPLDLARTPVKDTPTSTPADLPPGLRLLAVPRRRAYDNRRYTVLRPDSRAEFRLQLFVAAGVRPVAVAIQICAKDPGASLMNGAERYAAAAWQDHFASHAQPPLWVARMILPGNKINQSLTDFKVVEPYRLRSPSWSGLSDDQLQVLAGAPVDLDRH